MPVIPGARFGPYEVVSLLGAGGMGEVYRARDTNLGRDVAVKVLPAGLANDPEAPSRLEREARAVSITARLREVLQRRQTGPDGQTLGPGCYVFGTDMGERRGDVRGAWRRACDAPGITNLHMHDLRREFASRLLESGANTALVRDWLGHASLTMTSRYLATTASASKPRGHSSSATPHSAPSHLGQRRG